MLPPSGSRSIRKMAFEEGAHLRGWHGRWVDMGGGRRRHEVTGPGGVSHVKESKTAFTHASYRPPEAGANSGVQFHTNEAVARKRASGPFRGGEVIPLKGEGGGPAKLEPELSGIDDMAARARRADERRMRQIEQDRQRKAPTPAPKPKASAGGTVEKPKLVKREVGARNPSQSSRLKKKYDVLVNGEKVGEVRQVQHMIRLGGAYTTGWAPDFTEWKFYEGSNNFPHEVRLRQAHTRAELMPRVVEHLKSKQSASEAKPSGGLTFKHQLGSDPNGERIQVSAYVKTHDEAKEHAAQFPKSVGVKASTLWSEPNPGKKVPGMSMDLGTRPSKYGPLPNTVDLGTVNFHADLRSTGVTGQANEGGLKRWERFQHHVKRLGHTIEPPPVRKRALPPAGSRPLR